MILFTKEFFQIFIFDLNCTDQWKQNEGPPWVTRIGPQVRGKEEEEHVAYPTLVLPRVLFLVTEKKTPKGKKMGNS